MSDSDFVREVGRQETDAWLEVDRLRAQQTVLVEALRSLLDRETELWAGDPAKGIGLSEVIERAREALATLDVEEKM